MWVILALAVVGAFLFAAAAVAAWWFLRPRTPSARLETSRPPAPLVQRSAPREPPAEAAHAEAAPVVPAPAPPMDAPAAVAFTALQKARIGETDPVLRASNVRFRVGDADVDVLAFVTEGFATRGAPELVLYLRRLPEDSPDLVRMGLKVLGGLTLAVLRRAEPLRAQEWLALPGTGNRVGDELFAGFVLLEPCESQPVPLPASRLILLGVLADELAVAKAEGVPALLASFGETRGFLNERGS